MKKIITIIAATLLFVSCSSNDEDIEYKTALTTFTEPYFLYEAPKSSITAKYGQSFNTESNNFSLGYKMKYKASENGIVNYYFSLDNQETLYETEVLFHSGKENVDFLKIFLNSNYTLIEENTNSSLYNGRFQKGNVEVELGYLDGTFSGTTLTYQNKI